MCCKIIQRLDSIPLPHKMVSDFCNISTQILSCIVVTTQPSGDVLMNGECLWMMWYPGFDLSRQKTYCTCLHSLSLQVVLQFEEKLCLEDIFRN